MTDENKKILSYNIKLLRKKEHMTQAELADLLSVRQSTISEWEKGRSEPDSISLLKKICSVFKVTYNQLLNDRIDQQKQISEMGGVIARRLENLTERERNEAEQDIIRYINFKYGSNE